MLTVQESLVHNYSVFHGRPGAESRASRPRPVPLGSALDPSEAYAMAAEVVALLAGRWETPLAGYKISMTSEADQANVHATEPAYGLLTTAHLAVDHHVVDLDAGNLPLVEPELVLRATAGLERGMTGPELLQRLEVTAGLEIPVCRIPGWWPEGQAPAVTLSDFLMDNAAAGFVVHGEAWLPASSLDLAALTVEVRDPHGDRHRGEATRVLGNPLNAVRWLMEALDRSGAVVPAGSVVSSGTFMSPLRAVRGDYTATFSHGLGAVGVRFD